MLVATQYGLCSPSVHLYDNVLDSQLMAKAPAVPLHWRACAFSPQVTCMFQHYRYPVSR